MSAIAKITKTRGGGEERIEMRAGMSKPDVVSHVDKFMELWCPDAIGALIQHEDGTCQNRRKPKRQEPRGGAGYGYESPKSRPSSGDGSWIGTVILYVSIIAVLALAVWIGFQVLSPRIASLVP